MWRMGTMFLSFITWTIVVHWTFSWSFQRRYIKCKRTDTSMPLLNLLFSCTFVLFFFLRPLFQIFFFQNTTQITSLTWILVVQHTIMYTASLHFIPLLILYPHFQALLFCDALWDREVGWRTSAPEVRNVIKGHHWSPGFSEGELNLILLEILVINEHSQGTRSFCRSLVR